MTGKVTTIAVLLLLGEAPSRQQAWKEDFSLTTQAELLLSLLLLLQFLSGQLLSPKVTSGFTPRLDWTICNPLSNPCSTRETNLKLR